MKFSPIGTAIQDLLKAHSKLTADQAHEIALEGFTRGWRLVSKFKEEYAGLVKKTLLAAGKGQERGF